LAQQTRPKLHIMRL